MKSIRLIIAALLLGSSAAVAQVNVNINFGTPPVWAPADRVEVQYYYLPEIDVYYDVPNGLFLYFSNGRWIRNAYLPARCNHYDLRRGRVVYLTDYYGKTPYYYHKRHRARYVTVPQRTVVVYRDHDDDHDRGRHHGHEKHRGHGKKRGHGHD
ncbi:hypothetical protein [Flavobacterium stagni]|jgi:hypothetical protein|uniref:Uncharacterized protein n=1 Tax=Flavobacterium stagni TaxID=2506421 RepID=A0A4V1N2E5_9FLAO|nr:hypothetical protein [Flavobacterium stagni]RXR21443.1 hypothetical protein EQG61_12020 [Flavobacterium stagni]